MQSPATKSHHAWTLESGVKRAHHETALHEGRGRVVGEVEEDARNREQADGPQNGAEQNARFE
jgi:hypothetical protein